MRRKLFRVTDHFAELGIPRAAWIDATEIKDRHHQLMVDCHPDKVHGNGDRATRLNAARRSLDNPAARLKHLLELEFPGFQSLQKPEADWDFFSKIAQIAKMAADLTTNLAPSTSPLARAVAQKRTTDVIKAITDIQNELRERELALENRTRLLSASSFEAQTLSDLAEEWTFLNRWKSAIREARALI